MQKNNKYTKEIIDYARKRSNVLTEDELILELKNKFNIKIEYKAIYRAFAKKYNICCIDYKPKTKYNDEILKYIKEKADYTTTSKLFNEVKEKFGLETTRINFKERLRHLGIKCLDDNARKNGTEIIDAHGRIHIKVANDVWILKTRVMYEKYYNVKLKKDEFIIQLNNDKTDFSKDNLYKLSKDEFYILHFKKLRSSNKDLTKLGILSSKLMLKAKNM